MICTKLSRAVFFIVSNQLIDKCLLSKYGVLVSSELRVHRAAHFAGMWWWRCDAGRYRYEGGADGSRVFWADAAARCSPHVPRLCRPHPLWTLPRPSAQLGHRKRAGVCRASHRGNALTWNTTGHWRITDSTTAVLGDWVGVGVGSDCVLWVCLKLMLMSF